MIQPAEIKSVCRYGSNNNSKKILPVYEHTFISSATYVGLRLIKYN